MRGTPFAMTGMGGFHHAPWIKKWSFYRSVYDLPADNYGGWITISKVLSNTCLQWHQRKSKAFSWWLATDYSGARHSNAILPDSSGGDSR